MRRSILLLSVLATLGSATFLYATAIETRQMARRVHTLERLLERAEADVAVLRAERAYLGRPERIEALARAMGLVAASPGVVTLDDLPRQQTGAAAQ